MTKFHRLIDRICAHSNAAAHGVEIPAGARLLFTNGQVGRQFPAGGREQCFDGFNRHVFPRCEDVDMNLFSNGMLGGGALFRYQRLRTARQKVGGGGCGFFLV